MDEEALLIGIKARLAIDPRVGIQLKADGGTAGNRIVLLMEGLRKIGVEELHLLTLPVER